MNDFDLDTLLRDDVRLEPHRALRPDFAAQVVAELNAHPDAPRKEHHMKQFFTRPIGIVLSVALVLLLGGTSYALTDGFTKLPDLKNLFGYQATIEPNGDKILTVKTADCSSVRQVSSAEDTSDRTLYLRIKADAPVSTDEALSYAQYYCEWQTADAPSTGGFMPSGTFDSYTQDQFEVFAAHIERVIPCPSSSTEFCNYLETAQNDSDTTDSAKKAKAYVEKAYSHYVGQETVANKIYFKEHFVTAELAARLDRDSPVDTIMCVQNTVASITYGTPIKISDNSYVIPILGTFIDQKQFNMVDVTYSTSLNKITSIDCPPQAN